MFPPPDKLAINEPDISCSARILLQEKFKVIHLGHRKRPYFDFLVYLFRLKLAAGRAPISSATLDLQVRETQ